MCVLADPKVLQWVQSTLMSAFPILKIGEWSVHVSNANVVEKKNDVMLKNPAVHDKEVMKDNGQEVHVKNPLAGDQVITDGTS